MSQISSIMPACPPACHLPVVYVSLLLLTPTSHAYGCECTIEHIPVATERSSLCPRITWTQTQSSMISVCGLRLLSTVLVHKYQEGALWRASGLASAWLCSVTTTTLQHR